MLILESTSAPQTWNTVFPSTSCSSMQRSLVSTAPPLLHRTWYEPAHSWPAPALTGLARTRGPSVSSRRGPGARSASFAGGSAGRSRARAAPGALSTLPQWGHVHNVTMTVMCDGSVTPLFPSACSERCVGCDSWSPTEKRSPHTALPSPWGTLPGSQADTTKLPKYPLRLMKMQWKSTDNET